MSYADRDKNRKLTGRWVGEVDTRRPDGTELRYRKRFASKGEADGYEAYVKATGNEPPGSTRAPTNSFKVAADRFKAENKSWVDAHDTNAQRLEHATNYFALMDVGAIRKTQLLGYVEKLRGTGRFGKRMANETINGYLNAVSKVLRDCFEREEIATMPTVPRQKANGKTRDVVEQRIEDGAVSWLATRGGADKRGVPYATYAFLVRVLAVTGMRCGELYELQPEQIELPEQVENTGWMLTKEQTKTDEPRWVPIDPASARKLKQLLASKALPNQPHLAYQFKQGVKAAGGESDLTIHCLRHTTVTRLLQAGAQSIDVAKITGHSVPGVPKMQLRYYHPDKPHLFKVVEKVPNAAGEIRKIGEVVDLKSQQNKAQVRG